MEKEQYLDINGAELLWNRTKGQINELKGDLANLQNATEDTKDYMKGKRYLYREYDRNYSYNALSTGNICWVNYEEIIKKGTFLDKIEVYAYADNAEINLYIFDVLDIDEHKVRLKEKITRTISLGLNAIDLSYLTLDKDIVIGYSTYSYGIGYNNTKPNMYTYYKIPVSDVVADTDLTLTYDGLIDFSYDIYFISNKLDSIDFKENYKSGCIFFEVSVNEVKPFETSTSNSICDSEQIISSWCVLKLPKSYKSIGTPTKLCVFMHGSGGSFDNTTPSENLEITHANNLVENGYAVMDVSVASVHMGANRAMLLYHRAIEYVINKYNVESKIYLHGHSMGGLTALNFTNRFGNMVKVLGLWFPCVDLYNQGWLNTSWTSARENMGWTYYFDDTSLNTYEQDKTIGYNPIVTNTVTVNGVTSTKLPCPIKIWHGLADNIMPIQYSETYITNLKNGGTDAHLRKVENLGHEWSDVLEIELLYWFNRY